MVKPINEYGGWLIIFCITMWIGMIVNGLAILVHIFSFFTYENENQGIVTVLIILDLIIYIILAFRIIKNLGVKEKYVPGKIVENMTFILGFTMLFTILYGLLYYYYLGITERPVYDEELVRPLIRVLVWFAIWSSYFKRSKRVRAYYGSN